MSPKSYPLLRRWAPVALMALAIFMGSSLPGTSLPPLGLFPGQDKAVHLTEYALLGFLVARALRGRRDGSRRRPLVIVAATALLALLYGLSDEFHQSFVPARSVDALDALADLVGGATGALLYLLWCARRSRSDNPRGG
jgi:VanZ family protein